MTITKIFLLLVCAFVLVLLLSTIFNKHHRIIMWSAAIVFFIGTLLLIGLGIIDPVKDNNHPDPVVITGIFTALSYRVYLHTERKSYASNLGKITSKPFNP